MATAKDKRKDYPEPEEIELLMTRTEAQELYDLVNEQSDTTIIHNILDALYELGFRRTD